MVEAGAEGEADALGDGVSDADPDVEGVAATPWGCGEEPVHAVARHNGSIATAKRRIIGSWRSHQRRARTTEDSLTDVPNRFADPCVSGP